MSLTDRINYHLKELAVAANPAHSNHILPTIGPTDQSILDVGCGIGQTLIACDVNLRNLVVGIDIEHDSVAYGREISDDILFVNSCAESLPFSDNRFDLVISRVALPYTNVPKAIAEISRVLKPGGRAWFTLHPFRKTREQLVDSARLGDIKQILFRLYVIANGISLHLTGRVFNWPLTRQAQQFESWQSERAMRDCLAKQGFDAIQFEQGRFFKCEAHKTAQHSEPQMPKITRRTLSEQAKPAKPVAVDETT